MGDLSRPADLGQAPIETFNSMWDLQDYYADAGTCLRVQTWDGKNRLLPLYDGHVVGPFGTVSIWDYTDKARLIRVLYREDTWMVEAGEEAVAFRRVGTHARGPDDLLDYEMERQRVRRLQAVRGDTDG